MTTQKTVQRYVAFLRGINVGGHHKVPMADLKVTMGKLGFENVVTLLNSGNIIFDSNIEDAVEIEKLLSEQLEETFGFPIPTLIRNSNSIQQLYNNAPFQDIEVHKDIRLYVSFLKNNTEQNLETPWNSPDNAFKVLDIRDNAIISVLDLSISGTPEAMGALEKSYGKDITTRNWKTIERIVNKL